MLLLIRGCYYSRISHRMPILLLRTL
ncbi:unnamed protein product [Chondrus crispus]|uniref:Uncharacterized protein n=1 Tax=Chondrus crispus TaxID=2769 RepID=R7QDK4_CHOCR|nr:unnamed protein product [Chondrus crispus]CDF36169.1 unnamed protein product [Chondrus crispus]|eukprot:XP_005715988.1 unnamed protein product [Chondrus crispus]